MPNPYTDPRRPPSPTADLDKFLDWVSNREKEDARFGAIMMTKDSLPSILGSPYATERARLMLTGNNLFIFEVATKPAPERFKLIYPKVCEFTNVQMASLNEIFPITEYPLILKKRADPPEEGGCGDSVARKMLDQVIYGDRTAEEIELQEGVELTPRSKGLMRLYQDEENLVAGGILVRIGVLSKEDYEKKIKEIEFRRARSRPEMKVCPGCRTAIARFVVEEDGTKRDLGNFITVITQPYNMQELYCINCARKGLKAGTLTVVGEIPPEGLEEVVKPPEKPAAAAPAPPPGPPPAPAPAPGAEVPPRPPAEKPAAAFRPDKTEGPAPLMVKFTDESTGEVDSRSWDFGDGETATGKEVTHIFKKEGKYTVILVAAGPGGMNIARRGITVQPELEKPKVVSKVKIIPPKGGEAELSEEELIKREAETAKEFGEKFRKELEKATEFEGVKLIKKTPEAPAHEEVKPPTPPPARREKGKFTANFWWSGLMVPKPGIYQIDFGDDSSQTPDRIDWDYGDGTIERDVGRYPVHIYEKPGTYQVTMAAEKGKYRDTVTKEVKVEPQETVPKPAVKPTKRQQVDLVKAMRGRKIPDETIVKVWKERNLDMDILVKEGVKGA